MSVYFTLFIRILASFPILFPPPSSLSPASELVDCLIRMREASDRQEAVRISQILVNTDYIHHVVDEHNFEDGFLFFRFRQDGKSQLKL